MSTLNGITPDHFFQREHYEAFHIDKINKNTAAILKERTLVQDRLLDLHDILYPEIQRQRWGIYPHYDKNHLVSGIDINNPFIPNTVQSIWLHYGKSEGEIKKYKQFETKENPQSFIHHLRMQVIIFNHGRLNSNDYGVGTWLVIGKPNGSIWERDHIRNRLRTDPSFRNRLFAIVSTLGNGYSFSVNDDPKSVLEFHNSDELATYLLTDNLKQYFILGKDFAPSSEEITTLNIIPTIIREFGRFYPIYQLVKHTF